jgi:hypothetical protein
MRIYLTAVVLIAASLLSTDSALAKRGTIGGTGAGVGTLRADCNNLVRQNFCGGHVCNPPGSRAREVGRCVHNGGRL